MFYTNMVSDFTRLRYNVDSGISDSDSETGGISMKRIVRGVCGLLSAVMLLSTTAMAAVIIITMMKTPTRLITINITINNSREKSHSSGFPGCGIFLFLFSILFSAILFCMIFLFLCQSDILRPHSQPA